MIDNLFNALSIYINAIGLLITSCIILFINDRLYIFKNMMLKNQQKI